MAYMAYYQKPFEPTGDTIDVNITEPMNYKYYKSEGDWYMSGANAEYKVNLDVVNNDSTSPAGNSNSYRSRLPLPMLKAVST